MTMHRLLEVLCLSQARPTWSVNSDLRPRAQILATREFLSIQRVYSGHLHARSPFNENPPSCADSIYFNLLCVDGRC